jgi:hypothetical protein
MDSSCVWYAFRSLDGARTRSPGATSFLELGPRPLGRRQYRAWRRGRPAFRACSRFAVVGLPSRLLDAGFRATLLLCGTVPGGFTAAAHQAYAEGDQAPTYYGRAVRDGGYLVLQYWLYYWMNDWRSSFGGVNDHEGDWEHGTVFLTDPGGGSAPVPRWVAFSAHDTVGDDLRQRWDDPDPGGRASGGVRRRRIARRPLPARRVSD